MKNQKQLWIKLGIIFGLVMILQVPMQMIELVVLERSSTQYRAVSEISQSWGGEQSLIGPFLVVPFELDYSESIWDKNLEKYVEIQKSKTFKKILTPVMSEISSDVMVDHRKRGIYQAPVYSGTAKLSGTFDLSELDNVEGDMQAPEFVLLLSDLGGVLKVPSLNYGNTQAQFSEGGFKDAQGITAVLSEDISAFKFDFNLDLKGSQRIGYFPLGKNNLVHIKSNWLHPSFNGRFLPENYNIAKDGFSAKWRTTSLSSNVKQLIESCGSSSCKSLSDTDFGVSFVDPVNHYTMSSRASKYSILLIVITFSIFFLLEVSRSGPVHPVQYLLVGLALTVFNLVLVALTEHLDFAHSYLISAFVCLLLICTYAWKILKTWRSIAGFGTLLGFVYLLMFFILKSEDYAFLMGALFLLLILASIMLLTRNVDWYSLQVQLQQKTQSAEGMQDD